MSLKSLARAWNQFFFAPRSPTPLCLFRVLFGLLALTDFILLKPDWLAWFGTRSITTLQTMHLLEPGTRIDLFTLLTSDAQVNAFFWFAVISAICLIAGFLTRASSIAVFLCLISINERALYAMNSGDSLLRVTGFWLMFAPAGAAFSVDRLIRLRRGKEPAQIPLRAPWAQRMIQVQLSLVYLATFWQKTLGSNWLDGTALYYVYQLDQFHRFPLPSFIQDPMLIRLQTWITLAIEFSLGALIWFRELRYPLLALGLALHLTLEYSMNIPLFQWIILSVYVTFIEPEDLARAWGWISARVPIPQFAPAAAAAGNVPEGARPRAASGRGLGAARVSK